MFRRFDYLDIKDDMLERTHGDFVPYIINL